MMLKVICPTCGHPNEIAETAVSAGEIRCVSCHATFSLSEPDAATVIRCQSCDYNEVIELSPGWTVPPACPACSERGTFAIEVDPLGDSGEDSAKGADPTRLRQRSLPMNFFGLGTIFYGRRDFRADGTYLTTKWATILYVPLFPIWSYRVRDLGRKGKLSFFTDYLDRYEILERHPISTKQLLYTLGYLLALVVLLRTSFPGDLLPEDKVMTYGYPGMALYIIGGLADRFRFLRIPYLPDWLAWIGVMLLLWLPQMMRSVAMDRAGYTAPDGSNHFKDFTSPAVPGARTPGRSV